MNKELILPFFYLLTTIATASLDCTLSCVNQTCDRSANRLAQWLFDGDYSDQMNTYNATPVNTMSFIRNGYVRQAIQFVSSNNQTLNVPYIPLSSTSFTIDIWLYITGFLNLRDLGIFYYCSQVSTYNCLHITIRRISNHQYLYFDFFRTDCAAITLLTLNTWIHAAFVFDSIALTQTIYLDGVLENSCIRSSALTVTPTNIIIGFSPFMSGNTGQTYFQGSMDQMTVSSRAKSACEILEIATLVAHFTFDSELFLIDSGPNSLRATTQSTSSISSGRFSQAIHFDGSNSSYYQISDFTALGTSNKPFSISLWLRPTSLSGTVVHVSTKTSGNGWCLPFLGFALDSSFIAQIWNGTNVLSIVDPTLSVSISVWSHIVQTWSSTNGLRLYINNILVASKLYSNYKASSSPNYITLGNVLRGATFCALGGVNYSPYEGDMDDFRVYSQELSADDVCTLYTH